MGLLSVSKGPKEFLGVSIEEYQAFDYSSELVQTPKKSALLEDFYQQGTPARILDVTCDLSSLDNT